LEAEVVKGGDPVFESSGQGPNPDPEPDPDRLNATFNSSQI